MLFIPLLHLFPALSTLTLWISNARMERRTDNYSYALAEVEVHLPTLTNLQLIPHGRSLGTPLSRETVEQQFPSIDFTWHSSDITIALRQYLAHHPTHCKPLPFPVTLTHYYPSLGWSQRTLWDLIIEIIPSQYLRRHLDPATVVKPFAKRRRHR